MSFILLSIEFCIPFLQLEYIFWPYAFAPASGLPEDLVLGLAENRSILLTVEVSLLPLFCCEEKKFIGSLAL